MKDKITLSLNKEITKYKQEIQEEISKNVDNILKEIPMYNKETDNIKKINHKEVTSYDYLDRETLSKMFNIVDIDIENLDKIKGKELICKLGVLSIVCKSFIHLDKTDIKELSSDFIMTHKDNIVLYNEIKDHYSEEKYINFMSEISRILMVTESISSKLIKLYKTKGIESVNKFELSIID